MTVTPGGVKGPTPGQSQLAGEAEDSLSREAPVRAGAVLTTTGRPGTTRRAGSGKRDGKVYVRNRRLTPRKRCASSNLVDTGWFAARGRGIPGGCGGQLRSRSAFVGQEASGNSLRRTTGDAAGAEPGTSSVNRCAVNVGTLAGRPFPAMPSRERAGSLSAVGQSGGGGPVVVRARESRVHGEGVQQVRQLKYWSQEIRR